MVKERRPQESPMSSPLSTVTVTHKRTKSKQTRARKNVEAKSAIIQQAEKFRVNLGAEFPSFVKSLTRSHVSGASTKFSLPVPFSRMHLTGDESTVILVNECGSEYKVSYNMKRHELYWSRFSKSNKLRMGDVAVFQLIGHFKFKVYIVRENNLAGRDDLTLSVCTKQTASYSKLGASHSENDDQYSDHSDTEDSDQSDSDSEDSWEMVISGYQKKSERNKRKRFKFLPGNDVIERAKKIQANLPTELPSCIKPYSQSCHDREYLRLPQKFCKNHLRDDRAVRDVILVSEADEKEYEMKFIQDWDELNCGWTSFSKGNSLHVGDVLVLCLIGHFKFKVYIVRENELVGVNGTTCVASDTNHAASQTNQNVSEECVGSSGSAGDIFQVKSFRDFTILVNGINIGSKLSEETKRKYYELCCLQKSYLHQHLLEHVDTIEWVDAIIFKIVSISDDIVACRFSTPRGFYESRLTILESFEKLGMNVRFLYERLKRLMSIAFEPEVAEARRRQVEARHELSDAEEKIRALELEVLELQKKKLELVFEIEEKKTSTEDCEHKFLETAKAAW